MTGVIHPIEEESYRRMSERIDLSSLPPLSREVVARVIHATADLGYAETMVLDEAACEAGITALASGAPIITDVQMVRAAISGSECYLDWARSEPVGTGLTLSAQAMRLGARARTDGAVFAIGCAPTALEELITLVASGEVRPALVVGVPVGFVGASEAKHRLRATSVPAISNLGERGGSAVAAAVVNALRRLGAR